jgi:CHAT domain-containing protein
VSNLVQSSQKFNQPDQDKGTTVIAGTMRFEDGIAPLAMAEQEMQAIKALVPQSQIFSGKSFTADTLVNAFNDRSVGRIHLATHADTSLEDGGDAVLYTSTGELRLSELNSRLLRNSSLPLDLITISACRSGLSFSNQELGIAGAAVQLGARSTIGSSWYIDDVATASLFVLLYKNLSINIPKAEALRLAQNQIRSGLVSVKGNQVIGPNGITILDGLTRDQQLRYKSGFRHPYFWSGLQLIGSPW